MAYGSSQPFTPDRLVFGSSIFLTPNIQIITEMLATWTKRHKSLWLLRKESRTREKKHTCWFLRCKCLLHKLSLCSPPKQLCKTFKKAPAAPWAPPSWGSPLQQVPGIGQAPRQPSLCLGSRKLVTRWWWDQLWLLESFWSYERFGRLGFGVFGFLCFGKLEVVERGTWALKSLEKLGDFLSGSVSDQGGRLWLMTSNEVAWNPLGFSRYRPVGQTQ